MDRTLIFYLHLYVNKYGELSSSGWQGQEWCNWLYSNDRDESDMGDEKKTFLVNTDKRVFYHHNNQWFEQPKED